LKSFLHDHESIGDFVFTPANIDDFLAIRKCEAWEKLLCMHDKNATRRQSRQLAYAYAVNTTSEDAAVADLVNATFEGAAGTVPLPHVKSEFEISLDVSSKKLATTDILSLDPTKPDFAANLQSTLHTMVDWTRAARPFLSYLDYCRQACLEANESRCGESNRSRFENMPEWAKKLSPSVLAVQTAEHNITKLRKLPSHLCVCFMSHSIMLLCFVVRSQTQDTEHERACRNQRNDCFGMYRHLWMGEGGITFEAFPDPVKRDIATKMAQAPCFWPYEVSLNLPFPVYVLKSV
jgi:hypothetical protein